MKYLRNLTLILKYRNSILLTMADLTNSLILKRVSKYFSISASDLQISKSGYSLIRKDFPRVLCPLQTLRIELTCPRGNRFNGYWSVRSTCEIQ